MKDPLIFALDVLAFKEAKKFVRLLKDQVHSYKVGSVLFTAAGPDVVKMIHDEGGRVFLDLKFHDIPNTVAKACEAAAKLGVWLLDVHASGGTEMMRAACRGGVLPPQSPTHAGREDRAPTQIIGVTVLTSQPDTPNTQGEVIRLAKLCQNSGLAGVVCSPHEIEAVRKKCGKNFLIVSPGIRPTGASQGDQKRSATPSEAIRLGADYIVVGRPILDSPNPRKTVEAILGETSFYRSS